jgi:hypothetical protein
VPDTSLKGSLQGVVIGVANAVELIDVPLVRVLSCERARATRQRRLVNIQHHRELVGDAADIADLEDSKISQGLLDLKIVVIEVWSPEVLADGIDTKGTGSTVGVGSHIAGHACSYAWENISLRLPSETSRGVTGNRRRASGIAFETVGGAVWRTIIEEGIDVDLVVIHAEATAYHQIILGGRLVGETKAWSKVITVRRENRTDAVALDYQTFIGDKNGQILGVVMECPKYS